MPMLKILKKAINMEQKIIVTVGISGSGKSTWAAGHINRNPGFARVNRDSIRQQLTGLNKNLLNKKLEELVTKIQDEQVRLILSEGYSIVLDNTHLRTTYLSEVVKKFNHLADIEFKYFSSNVEECKERVSRREYACKEELGYIDKQYEAFIKLPIWANKSRVEVVPHVYNPDLYDSIICDLDGTLSLYDHKTKSAYCRDFENDTVNEPLRTFLEEVALWHEIDSPDEQSTEIFFFSGRSTKFREQTEQFLSGCFGSDIKYTLVMREEGDNRRDSVVKLDMFEEHIRFKYNVLAVFDDRLQVIEECWNRLGVFVFNCNQGNNRF